MPNSAPLTTVSPKTYRWIDLIGALLSHHKALTFEELVRYVPAYAAARETTSPQSVKRMFERDKKELREFGIPLETIGAEGDENSSYRIVSSAFYMPYLAMADQDGVKVTPRTVGSYGYQGLNRLSFEPDELLAVSDAIDRVAMLDDPLLTKHAESAARKLAFDLPIDDSRSRGNASEEAAIAVIQPRQRADTALLHSLTEALVRRKFVEFEYRSMNSDSVSTRKVNPYGLFFLNGHWYLVGLQIEINAIRNFRVSRITDLRVNPSSPSTSDYFIPMSFQLRSHAQSRQAWELGDGDVVEVTVDFTGEGGDVVAGAALGEAHPEIAGRRTFKVRRMDAFARWLISFAGEAKPVAPAVLIEEYRNCVAATLDLYVSDPGFNDEEDSVVEEVI